MGLTDDFMIPMTNLVGVRSIALIEKQKEFYFYELWSLLQCFFF